MQASTESAELKLVDGVELKLAMANDPASLARLTSIYLCPLLLKAGSEYASVRLKTTEICAMLNNRLSRTMQLPLAALWAQYKDPKTPTQARVLTTAFLQSAVEQSKSVEYVFLVDMLHTYVVMDRSSQPTLFQIVLSALARCDLQALTSELISSVNIKKLNFENQTLLAKPFLDLMFLNLGYFGSSTKTAPSSSGRHTNQNIMPDRKLSMMQGLAEADIEFLTPHGAATFTVTELNFRKQQVLHLSRLEFFDTAVKYVLASAASYDLNDNIRNTAQDLIKRRLAVDVDDQQLITLMYDSLLTRPRLPVALRLKYYQLLTQSQLAAQNTDKAIPLINKGLIGKHPRSLYADLRSDH